ncbi:ATP-binding protein [Alteromonas sp. ASW11-19]|uniref:histidine kinase n=1 Tax=Alteromonas salexigens TaxID=2982530 RepID=A0ABT2VSD4_9ALTE|nr:ATP-binding protein [Alteromonas salexigens]MCU7555343.1 ATP-binding protein [Alteromonas salexigens]
METPAPDTRVIAHQIRTYGFWILLVFSVIILAALLISRPAFMGIALLFPVTWLILALIALTRPVLSSTMAIVWATISTPAAPLLIVLNGMLPATLIALATIVPVMLLSGVYRFVVVVALASCTLLVPFSAQPYDFDVWVRLCITNYTVAAMVYVLVTLLENALATSINKSQSLEEALVSEQQAKETQSRFLATMSHELRTPMNGLLGLLESVLLKPMDESQRPTLETARRSGQMLNSILNDILDYSKLSAGKLAIEATPVNVPVLLEDVLNTYRPLAKEKHLPLELHVADTLAKQHLTDPLRLAQIMNNLLSNAIKYTTAGHISVEVTVLSTHDNSQTLAFRVSDTGIGIAEDRQEHIFEPYAQARDSDARLFGGTGLGLQIARDLATAMQGTLTLQSTEGQGSVFTLQLPLPICDTASTTVTALPYAVAPFKRRVLVTDDNEINRLVIGELLEGCGLTLSFASSGREAVTATESTAFDLILMDLHMPDMDGLEAARRIRTRHPHVPIVAVSAAVLEDEVAQAFSAGMNGHLAKPVTRERLLATLQKHLSHAKTYESQASEITQPATENITK